MFLTLVFKLNDFEFQNSLIQVATMMNKLEIECFNYRH